MEPERRPRRAGRERSAAPGLLTHPESSAQPPERTAEPAAAPPSAAGTAAATVSGAASARTWHRSRWQAAAGCIPREQGGRGVSPERAQGAAGPAGGHTSHHAGSARENGGGGDGRTGREPGPHRQLLAFSSCTTVGGSSERLGLQGEVTSGGSGGPGATFCRQLLYLACSTDGSKSCLFALVRSTSRGN